MLLSDKILEAMDMAARLHNGQTRKSDPNLPYIVHPFAVAWILNAYTDNEDVIVAGLLHDVLEDVRGYEYDDMVRDFGTRVADIVKGVSEDKDPNVAIDKKATWLDRKQKYIAQLEHDSTESLMVCAADKIHNIRSLVSEYKVKGDEMWAEFNSPADKRIWYYEKVYEVLARRLKSDIVDELEIELDLLKITLDK
jgi:(p)ppGpp synthase/HD superfamily hydrolase